jgi:hypothetical protein
MIEKIVTNQQSTIDKGGEERMVAVVPLRYDTVFKKAFGKPDIFCQFVYDVLGNDFFTTTSSV